MAAAIREVMASRDTVELTAPAGTMTRLIALPFRVLRPDAETDFLAFSLPDAITMSLSGTRNLLARSAPRRPVSIPRRRTCASSRPMRTWTWR